MSDAIMSSSNECLLKVRRLRIAAPHPMPGTVVG